MFLKDPSTYSSSQNQLKSSYSNKPPKEQRRVRKEENPNRFKARDIGTLILEDNFFISTRST
jgi:hypothetical protein